MASHYVAIAKASFAAALLRPDPTTTSRDEIGRLHTLLEAVVTKCTPSNVQNCKDWLSLNVVPSTGRITAFGKYLAALSTSYGKAAGNASSGNGVITVDKPSIKRKRLHLLYILNDLLHHAKYHTGNTSAHATLSSALQPQLVSILTSAASFDLALHPNHHRRLDELLDVWTRQGYYSQQYIDKLREAIKNAIDFEAGEQGTMSGAFQGGQDWGTTRVNKDVPFIMPATHGDPATPYYDLPAANMMPHIIPNSSEPINPQLVKPLQFVAGPADESLANVVRDFLMDVEMIYSGGSVAIDQGIVADIDEIGQPLIKDEVTGELSAVEGYYGWSIAFCEKMRKRRKEGIQSEQRESHRSRSQSTSSSPYKRRRYSSSGSSRSRSRGRQQTWSRSRSREITSRNGERPSSPQPPILAVPPISRSPPRVQFDQRDALRPQSHSQAPHQAPPHNQHLALPHLVNAALVTPVDQIDNPFHAIIPPPPPTAPNASHFQHNFPIGPGGLPIPPPPPFHTGPWPPPPPQIPGGMTFNPGQFPNFSTMGFLPPPPPPPQHWQGGPTPPPPPPAADGWQARGMGRGQVQRGQGQGQGDKGGHMGWQRRGNDPRRR